jgi:hypothetical protein
LLIDLLRNLPHPAALRISVKLGVVARIHIRADDFALM